MFDKETRKAVELANARLGTDHRIKPYDLNNAADLKHALPLAVGAYRDYRHYADVLLELGESFDESLEHFDIASWLNMGTEKADTLSDDCAGSLNAAHEFFDDLMERAKENFAIILKAVISAPPSTQKSVLGRAYKINPKELDERINGLIEALNDVEYHHPIPDNFDAFIKLIGEEWGVFEQ